MYCGTCHMTLPYSYLSRIVLFEHAQKENFQHNLRGEKLRALRFDARAKTDQTAILPTNATHGVLGLH